MQTITASSIIPALRSGLYGAQGRRKPLFKVVTGVLAAEMMTFGFAPAAIAGNLPEMSSGYGPGMSVDGRTLTIDKSAGSSFTWDKGFNIGSDYTVQFQGIGVAMNKDTSGSLSSIFGSLFSDGAVYILNPNGILFGSSAVVDVHGLVAAAVGAVSGGPDGMTFSKLGSGSVINQGAISAGDFAYLVGKSVVNSGSISAKDVALAAFGGTGADSLTIASAANGAKITFNIPEGVVAEDDGDDADGGEVTVSGTITGIENETTRNGGRTPRSTVTGSGTDPSEEYSNIAMAGESIKIDRDITGKNVKIAGNKYVYIGTKTDTDSSKITVTAAGSKDEGNGNIDIFDSVGNVYVYGDLKANNNIKVTATGEGLPSNQQKPSVIIGGGARNVSIVAGGDIKIEGNKSAQLLTGTMTANGGTVTMSGKEYVAVNGGVKGKDVTLETTDANAKTLSTAVGGHGAGTAAGVIVLDSGSVEATRKLEITSQGAIEADGALTAKNATLTANAGGITAVNENNDFGTVSAISTPNEEFD